jgi:hypothetical protein
MVGWGRNTRRPFMAKTNNSKLKMIAEVEPRKRMSRCGQDLHCYQHHAAQYQRDGMDSKRIMLGPN